MTRLPTSGASENLRVVLVSTRNPLNIGAAARAMANFGFSRLRVVNPFEASFREAKSAVGATAVLARAEAFDSLADAVADCVLVVGTTAGSRRDLQQTPRSLAQGARLIREKLRVGPVAVLFGSEKRGLSNADLSHCHWLMRVPTGEAQPSMNLGQAVAVCLYELARGRAQNATRPKLPGAAPAKTGEVERITTMLLDALGESGYIKPRSRPVTAEKVRRLVRRMDLRAEDAQVWLGIWRQLLWKLRDAK